MAGKARSAKGCPLAFPPWAAPRKARSLGGKAAAPKAHPPGWSENPCTDDTVANQRRQRQDGAATSIAGWPRANDGASCRRQRSSTDRDAMARTAPAPFSASLGLDATRKDLGSMGVVDSAASLHGDDLRQSHRRRRAGARVPSAFDIAATARFLESKAVRPRRLWGWRRCASTRAPKRANLESFLRGPICRWSPICAIPDVHWRDGASVFDLPALACREMGAMAPAAALDRTRWHANRPQAGRRCFSPRPLLPPGVGRIAALGCRRFARGPLVARACRGFLGCFDRFACGFLGASAAFRPPPAASRTLRLLPLSAASEADFGVGDVFGLGNAARRDGRDHDECEQTRGRSGSLTRHLAKRERPAPLGQY